MEPIAHILMVYFFPFQLVVGLVGNALNLLVLLNRQMRSRTNTLLAAVAFADIFFFFFMLPYNFKYFSYLRRSEPFGSLIQYANPHITGLVNMCAFASTWFLVAVCFERLLAVRWPLKARTFWSDRGMGRPSSIILVVCVFALVITLHSHITQEVRKVEVNGKHVLRVTVRESMKGYWRVATIAHTVLQVFIPVILVALTSLLMADALFAFLPSTKRRQRKEEELLQADNIHPPPTPSGRGEHFSISSNPGQGLLSLAQQQLQQRMKLPHQSSTQKRATYTVLIIAVAFALFQLPSTVIYIWELLDPEAANSVVFITLGTVANSLVVSGKMANFFLFCMSSYNFRRNLKRVLCAKCGGGKQTIPNITSSAKQHRGSGEKDKMGLVSRPPQRTYPQHPLRLGSLEVACPSSKQSDGVCHNPALTENGTMTGAGRKYHSIDATCQDSREKEGVNV